MRRCTTLLATLLLTGCVRFEPRPISPADTATQLEARRLDQPGLRQFIERQSGGPSPKWPLQSWDLSNLTLAAYFFQPSLEVVRAQFREAVAGIQTAKGRPNPALTVTPGYDTSVPGGINPWFPFVGFDLPIETAGKRSKRIAQATQLSAAAHWNTVSAVWQVRSGVRSSLLDFAASRRRADALRKQTAAQEHILKLLEQRAGAGAISRSDLAPSRLALSRTRLDLGDAESRQAEARAKLAQAVGVPVEALNGLELNFDFSQRATAEMSSPEARRIALQTRSDILGGLAEYAAAEESLRLEIAKQYPDIHVSPGYQFDLGEHKWSLGMTVDLPILNQNQGPIAEARARRNTAAARFTELQATVIHEVDSAVAGYRIACEQLNACDSLSAAGRQQEEAVAAQIQAGAADSLDLLNAQVESAAAALARLDGETRMQQALGALENALQRPVTPPVAAGLRPAVEGGILPPGPPFVRHRESAAQSADQDARLYGRQDASRHSDKDQKP